MFSAELGMVVSHPCWCFFSLIRSPFGEYTHGPLGFREGGKRGTLLGIVVEALVGFYFDA